MDKKEFWNFIEERFIYFNNHYYSQIYGDSKWAEYLEVFDKLFVIARVKKQTSFDPITKGYKITKNPNIISIYKELKTDDVILDKITLESVKNEMGEIIAFKNPKWDYNLDNVLVNLGLKKSWE